MPYRNDEPLDEEFYDDAACTTCNAELPDTQGDDSLWSFWGFCNAQCAANYGLGGLYILGPCAIELAALPQEKHGPGLGDHWNDLQTPALCREFGEREAASQRWPHPEKYENFWYWEMSDATAGIKVSSCFTKRS